MSELRGPRRSSRLRGSSVETPTKPETHKMHRLSSLEEEAPNTPIPAVSSPAAARTPATAGRIQPPREQMHPGIGKPSTAKEPDTGMVLGFQDLPSVPSLLSTPSKVAASSPAPFNFQYTGQTPQLSEEAQRMMDSLRAESTKIREKLAAQHEEEKRNGGESSLFGARKIAQPKPKAGRYSDAHKEEFRKMDSIASHPSAFRTQYNKPTASTSLKRTQSKAKLDEDEEQKTPQKPTKSLKRTQSKAQLDEPDNEVSQHKTAQSSARLENTAPAKRARQQITDDASTSRPVSRGGGIPVPTSNKPQPTFRSRFNAGLKALTTPTKASAARAAALKDQSTSKIPTMPSMPSMANLTSTPRGLTKSKTTGNLSGIPRPEPSHKAESPAKEAPTTSKLDRFKSMLHRNPSPSKVAASSMPTSIPSLKKSPTKKDLGKELPPVPTTPAKDEQAQTVKHVSFTPGTVSKPAAQETPSPKKSGIPRSATMMNLTPVAYPSLNKDTNKDAVKAAAKEEVNYPTISTPGPVSQAVKQAVTEPRPAQPDPTMFTFRSNYPINFGSSPGQASVRVVRPSILPTEIPGSFPLSDQENVPNFPTIPHGMSNKKRRRHDSDADKDEEAGEDDGQSPSKKLKSRAAEGQMLVESLQRKILPVGKSPRKMSKNLHSSPAKNASPSKGKGLSLSRLNMLARPKNRK